MNARWAAAATTSRAPGGARLDGLLGAAGRHSLTQLVHVPGGTACRQQRSSRR